MNTEKRNARSQMQGLFVDFHFSISMHGFTCIVKEDQNLSISHVITAIKRTKFKESLEYEFCFSQHELKNYFTQFFDHVIKLSETSQFVDSGPQKKRKYKQKIVSGNLKEKKSG